MIISEPLNLGDSAGELDAMDWMLTHQLSSKNLTAAERIQMAKAFEEEIRLENEKKKLVTLKQNCNMNRCDQLVASRDYAKNTSYQLAKKAGVGVGTVIRYNKVMKSGTDEQKAAVRTGQKTINKAYTEIRQQESTL